MVLKVSSALSCAAAVVAAGALDHAWHRRVAVFEALYLQRYWQLMDQLSLEALRAVAAGPVRGDDEKTIRNYLALCEDELELRARGHLSSATWNDWGPAMLAQLESWPFSEVWRDVQRDTRERPRPPLTLLREFARTGADPYCRNGRGIRGEGILPWLRGAGFRSAGVRDGV